jgi:hypothetical protein
MSDNPNQDIIIAKLLPFPNKSKIINAIEYENPRVNFAVMAQKLQNIKVILIIENSMFCRI